MSISSSINDCYLIDFEKVSGKPGSITEVSGSKSAPFFVKRVYYLYDVPAGIERGGHAHKKLYQLIVAASGSFEVNLDDGKHKRNIRLIHPYKGLLIKPGIWRELVKFSSGSICLVLASELYDPHDYIRNYFDFLKFKDDSLFI